MVASLLVAAALVVEVAEFEPEDLVGAVLEVEAAVGPGFVAPLQLLELALDVALAVRQPSELVVNSASAVDSAVPAALDFLLALAVAVKPFVVRSSVADATEISSDSDDAGGRMEHVRKLLTAC